MTNNEFLYQFDVLYNNETSNKAPNLNGYEKSVFLTKGQDETLKNHLNPKSNRLQEGIDDSSKRHIDFSKLIGKYTSIATPLSLYNLKILAILDETIEENGDTKVVIPISHQEYQRLKSKPYPYPLKNQVWRLFSGGADSIEFIGHPGSTLSNYKLRYVKYPNPIIVGPIEDFQTGEDETDIVTVNGYPKLVAGNWIYPDIEAPEELHQEILQRAVELAKIAWQGDLTATLTGGQRSE